MTANTKRTVEIAVRVRITARASPCPCIPPLSLHLPTTSLPPPQSSCLPCPSSTRTFEPSPSLRPRSFAHHPLSLRFTRLSPATQQARMLQLLTLTLTLTLMPPARMTAAARSCPPHPPRAPPPRSPQLCSPHSSLPASSRAFASSNQNWTPCALPSTRTPPTPQISTGCLYCFDMVNRYQELRHGRGLGAAREERAPECIPRR